MQKLQQNMQTWTPVALVLLQHRNKGARVLFHAGIGLGFNREQQKQFAEPDIIHSALKSAFGDSSLISRRADEHPVLAVGLLQFLWCHWPSRNAHLTRMFYVQYVHNMLNMCRICKICAPSSPYEPPPFRMNLPLSVCKICLNMTKNMQNIHLPQKNMPKNQKFQKFQKYVISKRALPQR